MCSCCVVGQGEGRFDAVVEIQCYEHWQMQLVHYCWKKGLFSVLTYCSCQRLWNKPGGCVTRVLKADPQSHTHKELSAAVQCSTVLSVRCQTPPCLSACSLQGQGNPSSLGCRRDHFPPLPALTLHMLPLTFLTLHSPPLLHLTAAGFSQTISSLLSGHTCRKK